MIRPTARAAVFAFVAMSLGVPAQTAPGPAEINRQKVLPFEMEGTPKHAKGGRLLEKSVRGDFDQLKRAIKGAK